MPTTLASLVIFVALLTPGLLNYIQRRKLSEQPQLSPLVEAGTLITVSLVTDLVTVGLFALVRWALPTHTPDISRLLANGASYTTPRLGYVILWGTCYVAVSSALAIFWVTQRSFLRKLRVPNIPDFADTTAWAMKFGDVPDDARVYVGCDLHDGSYVGGLLDWYSTDLVEGPHRDLVLAEPLTVTKDGVKVEASFQRVILSARDIGVIYVSYLKESALPTSEGDDAPAVESDNT